MALLDLGKYFSRTALVPVRENYFPKKIQNVIFRNSAKPNSGCFEVRANNQVVLKNLLVDVFKVLNLTNSDAP